MRKLSLLSFAGLVLTASFAAAEITVEVGPTSIPRGDAAGERDITISNGIFAVAFAVDTAPPWGVARGGIIDIALLQNGEMGNDIASLADFMPNRWSSWPTSYQEVTLDKQTDSEVVVRTLRDWGNVELESTFRIRDRDSLIRIETTMRNRGEAALADLYSGYVVWPDGGSLFSVPGLYGLDSAIEDKALADWSASYGADWVIALHAPFAGLVDYGGRDRYLQHSLAPGETRYFESFLQIEGAGSLAPVVQAEIAFREAPSGRLSGSVRSADGKPVARPAVVVQKEGQAYAWTIGTDGHYAIELPVGDYEVYATAEAHAQGEARAISVAAGKALSVDFADVRPPGQLQVSITDAESGAALDARISIVEGQAPLIGYFGRKTFFTELNPVGALHTAIAPGNYVLEISAAGGFTTRPQRVPVTIPSGASYALQVQIPRLATPQQQGWYSADLHHHSDVLDGFTDAEFVLRSELAAGVDIAFLSDHDSVINNARMAELAKKRGHVFMPGAELSPSWAHFNAYPIEPGRSVAIDTGQATVQEVFSEARRMGADIIEANHPYSAYGYFESHEKEVVPGGFDAGYDLVEIEPYDLERNAKTLDRVWEMWNRGERKYLAAGSDAHDVWLQASGSARTYVHVSGELSVEKYAAGLKAGHAYASQGPLVFPEILFGSENQHRAGDKLVLRYTVQAVSGLRSVKLIERGAAVKTRTFQGESRPVDIEFQSEPQADTWYSLVIEDRQGKFAYSNPIWVRITE